MPAERKTGGKAKDAKTVGKAKDAKSKPKQPPPPQIDFTVKDCMVWPQPGDNKNNAAAPKNQSARDNEYTGLNCWTGGNNGQLVGPGYDGSGGMKPTQQQMRQKERADEGTVIEALRGWPRHRQNDQTEEEEMDFGDCGMEVQPPPMQKSNAAKKTGGAASKNKQNKGQKKGQRVTQSDDDVCMGDIMSGRFLNEYTAQRQAEMDREQRKNEEKAQAMKDGRRAAKDRADIKANKTSALRSIANAVKVETSPMDLWKMPRFTKNAKSQLSTFRGQSGGGVGGGGGGYGRSAGDFDDAGYGPCTCDHGDNGGCDDVEEELMRSSAQDCYEEQSPAGL